MNSKRQELMVPKFKKLSFHAGGACFVNTLILLAAQKKWLFFLLKGF